MARSNARVRNKNAKGRLNRREHGASRPVKHLEIPRVKLEDMVMPDGQCESFGRPKARFGTEAKAAKALKQAQQQRERTGSAHVEKRYYACPEGGCGGFHLTSREAFDEKIWNQRRDLRGAK